MVNKSERHHGRGPALNQSRSNVPSTRASTSPATSRGVSAGAGQVRPWRQWHTASQGAAPAALEVGMPRKPQWGRWIYFAILLSLAVIAARFVYVNFFWYAADGFVSGRQYHVSPSDTVSIKEIFVSPSDSVEEGQLLVKLSSPMLVQSLAKNEAEIARLQSDLAQRSMTNMGNESQLVAKRDSLDAEMDYLESKYFQETQQLTALQELVEKGASQRGNLDELQSQRNKTWSEYKRVEAELRSAQAQLASIRRSKEDDASPEISTRLASLKELHASIEEQLSALELRAPTSGTVARVPVSKGDVLRAGEAAVELVDKQELRAYLYFPPAAQEKLQPNMEIPVTRADGSEVRLVVSKVYPSTASLPEEFRNNYQPDRSAVVVEATPVEGDVSELAMTSGTPIKGRIPRWSLPLDFDMEIPTEDGPGKGPAQGNDKERVAAAR
ncbi:HlyD family efflux transporter periplasmic adaptor subunit [Spongiibacter taiwanensis]|uniref:HlyD family secretion protein n=1 Tax=Spongiibacter taiwanensis TaxID=1748242 RepID=UPI0020352008|nr:HlyD family efflux transporter periplasmic adaptor subunit [Spongiibacter taiwanensis]USA42267.1 HlyD family efflux transporter periplasmic adaptor subunit [Spongiibacter taiwanensis]